MSRSDPKEGQRCRRATAGGRPETARSRTDSRSHRARPSRRDRRNPSDRIRRAATRAPHSTSSVNDCGARNRANQITPRQCSSSPERPPSTCRGELVLAQQGKAGGLQVLHRYLDIGGPPGPAGCAQRASGRRLETGCLRQRSSHRGTDGAECPPRPRTCRHPCLFLKRPISTYSISTGHAPSPGRNAPRLCNLARQDRIPSIRQEDHRELSGHLDNDH